MRRPCDRHVDDLRQAGKAKMLFEGTKEFCACIWPPPGYKGRFCGNSRNSNEAKLAMLAANTTLRKMKQAQEASAAKPK
jgi:hypothetical protein